MKARIFVSLLLVFAFVLPALAQGIDGKWEAKQTNQRGETTITFEFKNAGGKVTGTMLRSGGGGGGGNAPQPVEIKNGKFEGGKLTFEVSQAGRGGGEPTVITYTGTLSGDSIKFVTAGGRGAQELEAKRVK
jgi:hypothetical protein